MEMGYRGRHHRCVSLEAGRGKFGFALVDPMRVDYIDSHDTIPRCAARDGSQSRSC